MLFLPPTGERGRPCAWRAPRAAPPPAPAAAPRLLLLPPAAEVQAPALASAPHPREAAVPPLLLPLPAPAVLLLPPAAACVAQRPAASPPGRAVLRPASRPLAASPSFVAGPRQRGPAGRTAGQVINNSADYQCGIGPPGWHLGCPERGTLTQKAPAKGLLSAMLPVVCTLQGEPCPSAQGPRVGAHPRWELG